MMKKPVSVILAAATAAASLSCAMITADAATIRGDVNGDNRISLRDASVVQKINAGMITPNDAQRYSADFDGNGTIAVADAFVIQKFVCLDKTTLDKYAPNRAERIEFLEALNSDRVAAGLSPIEYNDAMLEAGNIRALEYMTMGNHDRPSGAQFYTVIEECNLRYNSDVTPREYAGEDSGDGTTFYKFLKSNGAGKTDGLYSLIMSAQCTTVCVGSIPDPNETGSNRTHYWVVLAN